MDILEALLRILYLFIIYAIIFNVFVTFTPLRGNSLIATSLFGAVLLLYATYVPIKTFLSNNEIVFQLKEVESEDEENETSNTATNNRRSNSVTNIYNEHNVTNDNTEVSNVSRVGHTHEFLTNGM